MHQKVIRPLGAMRLGATSVGAISFKTLSVAIVGGAFAVACAGGDTPARDDELEDAIAVVYADGVGVAGSGPAPVGGSGGRPAAPPIVAGGAGGGASQGGSNAASGAGGAPGGAGGTDPVGTAGSSGAGCDGHAILQAKCNGGSCHGSGSSVSGFAESEAAALSFIDKDPSAMGQCSGNDPIIIPDNPGNSLIIQKLDGSMPCGSPMPFGPPLSGDEIQCIEDWIGTL
jgi:hypothetical protein